MDTVLDLLHEKGERIPRVYCHALPPLTHLQEPTIVGAFSYFYRKSRWRHLKLESCVWLEDVLETPPAIARAYLQLEYKRSPRVSHAQHEYLSHLPRVAPPQYVNPTSFAYGFYVDIRGAYWSILNVVGWNLDYFPGKWLARGRPCTNFPLPDHKVARTCLVSCAQSDECSVYYPWPVDDWKYEKRGNGMSNLGLWRLVLDVLHSIAAEAVALGACYVNNDGIIAPSVAVREKVCAMIESWGLTWSVKHEGAGRIKSSGTYEFYNGFQSGHNRYRSDSVALDSVVVPEYQFWLKDRFTHFAS